MYVPVHNHPFFVLLRLRTFRIPSPPAFPPVLSESSPASCVFFPWKDRPRKATILPFSWQGWGEIAFHGSSCCPSSLPLPRQRFWTVFRCKYWSTLASQQYFCQQLCPRRYSNLGSSSFLIPPSHLWPPFASASVVCSQPRYWVVSQLTDGAPKKKSSTIFLSIPKICHLSGA